MKHKGILKEHSDGIISISKIIHPLTVALTGWGMFVLLLLGKPEFPSIPFRYQVAILLALLLTVIIFNQFDVYRPWRGTRFIDELKVVIYAWITVVSILILLSFFTKTSTAFSRVWLSAWFLSSGCIIIIFRSTVRFGLIQARTKGWNKRQIVIVGTDALGHRIYNRLKMSPWTGLEVRAFFKPDLTEKETIDRLPVYHLNILTAYLEDHKIDQVWLALPMDNQKLLIDIFNQVRSHVSVNVRMVPDVYNLKLLNYSISDIAGLPVLNLSDSPMFGINQYVKALEDKVISFLLLILTLPLTIVIAILIKLTSKGSLFYLQERVSWNGSTFNMIKFRSMVKNAEAESGPVWAGKNDFRTTWIGKWIRKTSLDELPQFLNVLKGDMSIVGPRPERPEFIEKFKEEIPDYMQKHLVKAGITGWAQINGWRGETDLKTRIEYDLFYIENWSFWLDMKIILLTPFKGMVAKNAY